LPFVAIWILHLEKGIANTINSKAIFTCLIPELGIGELAFFSCRTHNEAKWSGGNFFWTSSNQPGYFQRLQEIGQPSTIFFNPCPQSHGFLSDNMM
jgi:hypothetical protein